MPECSRESQDYNEVTETGLVFALLSITAVITVMIMVMCQQRHKDRKFETSKNGTMERKKIRKQMIFQSNSLYWKCLSADKRMAREAEVKK
jgi:hypothetical protein